MFDEYKWCSNQSDVLLGARYYSPLCPSPCPRALVQGNKRSQGWEHLLRTAIPLFALPIRLEKQLCNFREVICAHSFSSVTAKGLWHLQQQPAQAQCHDQQVQELGCWVAITDSSSAALLCLMVSSKLLARFFSGV